MRKRLTVLLVLLTLGVVWGPSASSAGPVVLYAKKKVDVPKYTFGKPVKKVCPDGRVVTGGGAYHQDGQIVFPVSSAPADGPDGDHFPDDAWRVTLTNNISQTERVTVYAVCVKKAGVNYEYRSTEDLTVTAGLTQTGNVACSPGYHVTGGGATVTGNHEAITMGSSAPKGGTSRDGGWEARVNNGSDDDQTFVVWTVCQNGITDSHVESNVNPLASGASQGVNSLCPAGTSALGGGVELTPVDGRSFVTQNAPGGDPLGSRWYTLAHNSSTVIVPRVDAAICRSVV